MKAIEENTLIRVAMPAAEVTPEGRTLINNILRDNFGVSFEKYQWDWSWFVPRGDYSGTLPKRIARWLFKAHNITAQTSIIEQIGNIGSEYTSKVREVWIDFTKEFSWGGYDFGQKEGSCYFGGSYSHALQALRDHSCRAIRFFQPDPTNKKGGSGGKCHAGYLGFGRAWIVHTPDDLEKPVEFFTMFNAYGVSLAFSATVLCQYLGGGEIYKEVEIHNPNTMTSRGPMYINGGRGMAVGGNETINTMTKANWNWHRGSKRFACDHCGEEVGNAGALTDCSNEHWCQRCLSNDARRCAGDNRWYRARDTVKVDQAWYGPIYLATRRAHMCETCSVNYFEEYMAMEQTQAGRLGWFCEEHVPSIAKETREAKKN